MKPRNHFFNISFIIFLCTSSFLHGQIVSFGSSKVSLGVANGTNPNYISGEGQVFFIGGLEQDLSIKSIPFKLTGRLSNEPFRSGQPSYIKFSYQPIKRDLRVLDTIRQNVSINDSKIAGIKDSISFLQSKIAYLKQITLDSVNAPSMLNGSKLDSLNQPIIDPSIPPIRTSLDQLGFKNPKIDSLSSQIDMLQTKLDELLKINAELKSSYEKVSSLKSPKFLDGIRKFDLGMTSLSSGFGATNAVPIQGVRVKGIHKNWEYDVAGGMSVPNRLFSAFATDQLLNNSLNLANTTNFFAVNESRFSSTAMLTYNVNQSLKTGVEAYHAGRSIKEWKEREKGISNLNTLVFINAKIPFIRSLEIGGKTGLNTSYNDTLNANIKSKQFHLVRMAWESMNRKSDFELTARSVGRNYNGWTQGIYLKGFNEYKLRFDQRFGKKLKLGINAAKTVFYTQDSTLNVNELNLLASNFVYSFKPNKLIYGSIGLISTDRSPRLNGENYNLNAGVQWGHAFDKVIWENQAELIAFRMETADSIQGVQNYRVKSGLRFEKVYYAISGIWQEYTGLVRLNGTNKILQGEFGLNFNQVKLKSTASLLQSEQFGNDWGLLVETNFTMTDYFMWKINVQRWMKSDLVFFNSLDNQVPTPWFLNLQMVITIK